MRLIKCSLIAIFVPALLAVVAAVAATGVPARPTARIAVTVPQSTSLHVTLNSALASDRSMSGSHFEATISQPVIVNGKTVIPKGAQARGVILDARPSGRLKGRAHLLLALESIRVDGQTYKIRTASEARISPSHKHRDLSLIGGGAGGGLLIGAIAGGGGGALIGAPIGAGAGTAVALLTGKKNIRLPAETPLTFRLARPVTIDMLA